MYMEIGDMLKGFAKAVAGSSKPNAEAIFDAAVSESSGTASTWAGRIATVFLGRKYGQGLAEALKYKSVASKLTEIGTALAKATDENAKELFKGTGFENMSLKSVREAFSSAGKLASERASSGMSTFASRFQNAAGEYTFGAVARASLRTAAPVAGLILPYKIGSAAFSGISSLVPQTPSAAGQAAGQQW
jgi:hypothetical protein